MIPFKSYIKEGASQTYYIDVFPNANEDEIQKALREIIGWATYRSQNGEKISIIGRAINEYPILNGKQWVGVPLLRVKRFLRALL